MAGLLGGTFEGTVVVDPAKLRELTTGAGGPVYRHLMKRARAVQAEAKTRVGVYKPPPAGPRRDRQPGTLRDSIIIRTVEETSGGISVQVGSEDKIALIHHEGTVPHVIRPRPANPWQMLFFWWDKVGGVVAARKVNHPGTRPNRFLTDSLRVLDRG